MAFTVRRLSGLLVPFGALLLGTGCDIDCMTDSLDCWEDDRGHGEARTYDIAGVDEIDCRDTLRLTVRQGDTAQLRVTVPEHREDDIEVRIDGRRLRLGLRGGGWLTDHRAEVEVPALRLLEASEACRVRLEDVSSSGRIELRAGAASLIEGELDAGVTDLRLGSASVAQLEGRSDQLNLRASGASRANLDELDCRRVDARLEAAANVTVRVSDQLDVTARTASVLRYIGDPELGRVDLSGGSRLERER